MKLAFWCLVLSAMSALGQEREVTSITLYTRFEQTVPDAVLTAIRSELSVVLHPIGVDWQSLPMPPGTHVSGELAVVSFKGACDVENLLPEPNLPGNLGWTYVSRGVVMPFSDVDCGRIRGFLRNALLTEPPPSRPALFGRAVGCVLAHEIYHILARTEHHAGEGAGKKAYTVRDLLSPGFRFERRDLRAMLAGDAPPVRGPSGDK
jgi:hypothetical protein